MGDVGATRISLCGRLSVELDGRRVELPGRQGRLLLAYLVLHRDRAVRRDELVEALWPDGDAPAGGEALAPPLSRLRKALGPERLEGRGEVQLRLPADAWVELTYADDPGEAAAWARAIEASGAGRCSSSPATGCGAATWRSRAATSSRPRTCWPAPARSSSSTSTAARR